MDRCFDIAATLSHLSGKRLRLQSIIIAILHNLFADVEACIIHGSLCFAAACLRLCLCRRRARRMFQEEFLSYEDEEKQDAEKIV